MRDTSSWICFALVAATIARKLHTIADRCERASDVARQTLAPQVPSMIHRAIMEMTATTSGRMYLE